MSLSSVCLAFALLTQAAAVVAADKAAPSQTAAAPALMVEGSASYRERIALPPGAVLIVKVEDVSLMDAPAKVLAEHQQVLGGKQVPLAFAIPLAPELVDARRRYGVRATIFVDGQMRFTSTRHYPVLTQGAPKRQDLLLQAVPANRPQADGAALGADLGFALPASFAGIVPCADCQGIAQTLTLRPDGLYRLRSFYLGKPAGPFLEHGRWSSQDSGSKLLLRSGLAQRVLALSKPSGAQAAELNWLSPEGKAIVSASPSVLRAVAQVDPISETLRWRGELQWRGDAARFTDCDSGLSWPVATASGAFEALRVEFSRLRGKSDAPLLLQIDGHLQGLGTGPSGAGEQLWVDQVISAEAEGRCAVRAVMKAPPDYQTSGAASSPAASPASATASATAATAASASLTNTYWKLLELKGKAVPRPEEQGREVQITLLAQDQRVAGFSGCNRLMGSYRLGEAGQLKFGQLAGTMMACAPAAMALEQQVHAMLAQVASYRLQGQQLELRNAEQQVLARFEAVYLR
ncbi:YbaY family lipoprotein [Roseateles sp. PN1]|uniref:YbaY family lipoprotein n=1 Tax=Roseateles sp. PN1 TaxID=3137372 RepID=UPI0040538B07